MNFVKQKECRVPTVKMTLGADLLGVFTLLQLVGRAYLSELSGIFVAIEKNEKGVGPRFRKISARQNG